MKMIKRQHLTATGDTRTLTRTLTRTIHTRTDVERTLADFAAEAAVYQVREAVRLGHAVTLAIAQHHDYTTITIQSPASADGEDTAIVGHIAPAVAPRIAPHGGFVA